VDAHAIKEEVFVQAGSIDEVSQALELKNLLLLLDPPLALVVEADAIQEVPVQDDHLAIVEEEDAKAITKEVQALDEGMGGAILIEPLLLNPLLLNLLLVIKLDAIQEVPIEDSSGIHSHSTCPVIS